jgi:O-methyltransferase
MTDVRHFVLEKNNMNIDNFIKLVKPFTMTSIERIGELYHSLEYIRKNDIEGDFVECGVWKGGNILGIVEYLNFYNMTDRNVWLYDTFQGMTEPEDVDIDLTNQKASDILQHVLCYSSLDDVKKNLSISNFPKNNIKYIIGDICNTLNVEENIPNKISLLRLDTDWYKSTKKELEILYPLLINNGVLIVDDYGHWRGSKMAVDEYFELKKINPQIKFIDYTGIKIIKNAV